jgi:phosphoribosyl-AMP cyclohydrolase
VEADLPIRWSAEGLDPAIAQQHDTGEVLMMAWMNAASLAETLETGRVCYWSRSRGRPWRKGETSGQHQRLVELRIDCDGDTVLLLVDQTGAACHTGQRSCFHRAVRGGELVTVGRPGGALRVCDRLKPPWAQARRGACRAGPGS